MNSQIPEPDWRQFKRVHQDLLQRFSQRVLDELAAIVQAPEGTAHERYLRVYRLIETRDNELARAFDDFRRSTALMQLVVMRGMGLLTDEDLGAFSPQTQASVRGITSIFRGEPAAPREPTPDSPAGDATVGEGGGR
jgi:hypothetical protein